MSSTMDDEDDAIEDALSLMWNSKFLISPFDVVENTGKAMRCN